MTEDQIKRGVQAMCREFGEEPLGDRHWFRDGQHLSETFYSRNERALRAALAAMQPN